MTICNNLGPPGGQDGEGRATPDPAAVEKVATTPPITNAHKTNPPRRRCGADTVAQLRRRRQAAYRLASLDCGCRDPWPCRCSQPPLTDRALDGWRDAARHILDCGLTPVGAARGTAGFVGSARRRPAAGRTPAPGVRGGGVVTAIGNGHEPSRLRAALESAGGSLKSLTVLAPQNDPFRVDTDARHRDGAWLANTLDRLGIAGSGICAVCTTS